MPDTVRDIIKNAMFANGVLAANENPTNADIAMALKVLQNLIIASLSRGIGGAVFDKIVTDTVYDANINERIINGSGGNITVNLPTKLNNSNTPIPNGALIFVTGNSPAYYIYLIAKGSWVNVLDFDLNTVDPLGVENNVYLENILSAELCRRFGIQVTVDIAEVSERAQQQLYNAFMQYPQANLDPALNLWRWSAHWRQA